MLNVTSKSENETFLITRICEFTETWVVTQRDIEGHIKSHFKKHPQSNMIASFSFASMAHVTPMVELSNSAGWDFQSTITFNASTSEENAVNDFSCCGSVVLKSLSTLSKLKQVGFTHCKSERSVLALKIGPFRWVKYSPIFESKSGPIQSN